mmetsp:Transcript_10874/g.34549  ORF Transcript_10874/g.34549 Transcript_10874/m.34549 type:complete len:236 (-) Transcript_10874:2006-2713(-)
MKLSAGTILSIAEHVQRRETAVGILTGDSETQRASAALPGPPASATSLCRTVYPTTTPIALYARADTLDNALSRIGESPDNLPLLLCSTPSPKTWCLYHRSDRTSGYQATSWTIETDVAVAVTQSVYGSASGALVRSLDQLASRAARALQAVEAAGTSSSLARARAHRTTRHLLSQLRRAHTLAVRVTRHGTGQRASALLPPLAASTRGLAAIDRIVREASLRHVRPPTFHHPPA